MKKIKIIQFIHGLNTGGAETLVKEYALKLDKKKFDVVVMCLSHYPNSPYEKILRNNRINVIYLDDLIIYKKKNDFISKKIKSLYRFILVKNIINHENPDIIHIHLPICKYIKFSRPKKSTKLFYTIHGEIERYKKYDKVDFNCIKWLIKKYNMKIICLHDNMKEQANKILHTNNTIVLNNGIDLKKFETAKDKYEVRKKLHIPNDAYVIGHVGRFNKVKNHEFIVKIFNDVYRSNNKFFLLMVGDGEEKNNIISLLDDHGLKNNYLILSNRKDIPDLLNAMDCFILPSLSEGLGISLIEAQKIKLPCIVSDNIPNHAIISNLVKKCSLNDKQQWINALLNVDKPANITLNDNDWNIDKIIKKLEKIYLEEGEYCDKKNI